jgi:hypothetical protein
MNKHKHQVFLGSSKESIWLAKEVEGALHRVDSIALDAWYHFGSWSLGQATLENLERRLNESDFAIFVLSKDDSVQSRNSPQRPPPRDNVILELGLFMGHPDTLARPHDDVAHMVWSAISSSFSSRKPNSARDALSQILGTPRREGIAAATES